MRGNIPDRALVSRKTIPDAPAMLHRVLCSLLLLSVVLIAGDAREDWARVKALDSGPAATPKNPAEAAGIILAHLDRQEKALRGFLADHATDPNAFEARLRLARLLDLRSELKDEAKPAEAAAILEAAEKDAITPKRRAELDFAVLSHRMRSKQGKRPSAEERRAILEQARSFERTHPDDRRIPSLLAEVATLFDGEPKTKEALLLDAKKGAHDPVVKAQIDDDLKRLGFFGKPLPLRFTALDGRRADVNDWRGKVVAVVFFATWSDPAKAGFADIQQAVEEAGARAVLVAISLDSDRAALEAYMRERKSRCPVGLAEKGWNSPLIQALGINALPTAWLLDGKGIVRSLDALDDPSAQIRRLLEVE